MVDEARQELSSDRKYYIQYVVPFEVGKYAFLMSCTNSRPTILLKMRVVLSLLRC